MLWVLKRTVSIRRFFWAPKTYVQNDGLENIYNFMLKSNGGKRVKFVFYVTLHSYQCQESTWY